MEPHVLVEQRRVSLGLLGRAWLGSALLGWVALRWVGLLFFFLFPMLERGVQAGCVAVWLHRWELMADLLSESQVLGWRPAPPHRAPHRTTPHKSSFMGAH